ncbi:cytidine deaminase [Amaricoccus macauensis]|uniref:cytidine deaminase n=1 Tax=Amaricoccus macauensis TaxID=57001 RepID=UPI003C7D174D
MDLIKVALAAQAQAHAPYSGFKVGAALLADDGEVYSGCNVENVAFPEGTCAEAGAISAMILGGAREIREIVVAADSPLPVPPCGGCRQKIAEFAKPGTVIVMAGPEGEKGRTTLGELLPGSFGADHMDRAEK